MRHWCAVINLWFPACAGTGLKGDREMNRAIVGSLVVLLAGVTVSGDDEVTLPCGLIDEDNHGYDNLDVVVDGCVVTIDGTHPFNRLRVINGGVITHSAGKSNLHLTIATDLIVDSNSGISANGRGDDTEVGPGKGERGTAGYGSCGGGGAGYGGTGGTGYGSGGSGGSEYGSLMGPNEPNDLGSGGGRAVNNDGSSPGGKGGGCLRLTVGGVFTLDGSVTANGTNGAWASPSNRYRAGGGGSGGSIYARVGTIAGGGCMSADGGDAGHTSYSGGGAGGRIALYYLDVNGFDLGCPSVAGGAGREYGQQGSVFLWGPNRGPFVGNDSGTDCTAGYMDHFEVVFTRPIDANTFDVVNDVNLVGPCRVMEVSGPNLISAIAGFETYRIGFARQTQVGRYDLSVGPDITGMNGKLMDQNVNNIGGTDPDDIYKKTFGLCKGLPDACGHAIVQAEIDQWVSLGEPLCWLDSCHCRGDANGSCSLNAIDINMFRAAWPGFGGTYNPCCDTDYSGGTINAIDINNVRAAWPGFGGPGCSGIPCCE